MAKLTSLSPRNLLSKLLFSWLNPIFHKGFTTNTLETSDLHDLQEENKAEYETERLQEYWSKETEGREYKTLGSKPSIERAVWRCYHKNLLHSALYTVIESAARIVQALLIGELVTGLADESGDIHKASLQRYYVPALCLTTYTFVIALHRGQFLGKLYGMRLRVALTGLVYKKVSCMISHTKCTYYNVKSAYNVFLILCTKVHNFIRTSPKKFFDLNKTQTFKVKKNRRHFGTTNAKDYDTH